MVAEELKVVIRTEANRAIREMKQFERTVGKADKTGKGFSKSIGDIKVGTLAAVAAVTKIINISKEFIDAASRAQEINSKFATTFDDVAYSSERVASTLASSYGLAETTAKELLASSGDLLTGFGFLDSKALELSETITATSVDLASFQNATGGAEAVARAMQSAVLGETEAMKTYGVVIRAADVETRLAAKGLDTLTGEAKLQAEAQERLNIILEQSKNALGDYERTQDSYANVSRRAEEASKKLKEELGEAMLPVVGRVKDAWTGLITRLGEALEKSNDLREALKKLEEGEELGGADRLAIARKELEELEYQLQSYQDTVRSTANLEAYGISGQLGGEEAENRVRERVEMQIALKKQEIVALQRQMALEAQQEEERAEAAAKEAEAAAEAADQHAKDSELLAKMLEDYKGIKGVAEELPQISEETFDKLGETAEATNVFKKQLFAATEAADRLAKEELEEINKQVQEMADGVNLFADVLGEIASGNILGGIASGVTGIVSAINPAAGALVGAVTNMIESMVDMFVVSQEYIDQQIEEHNQTLADLEMREEERVWEEKKDLLKEELDTAREMAREKVRILEKELNEEIFLLREAYRRNLISASNYESAVGEANAEFGAGVEAAEAPVDAAEAALEEATSGREEKQDALQAAKDEMTKRILKVEKPILDALDAMGGAEKFFSPWDEWYQSGLERLDDYLDIVSNATSVADISSLDSKIAQAAADPIAWSFGVGKGIIPAARGFHGTVGGPQMFLAGEAGRERVDITPMHTQAGSSSGSVVININSPVYGIDDFTKKIERVKRTLVKRGQLTA